TSRMPAWGPSSTTSPASPGGGIPAPTRRSPPTAPTTSAWSRRRRRTSPSSSPPGRSSWSGRRRQPAGSGRRDGESSACSNTLPDNATAASLRASRARRPPELRAADVALLARVDADPVALVDEERHLDDGAGRQLRRLGHVRDRVALDAGLRLDDLELDRRGKLDARRPAVHGQHRHRARRLEELQLLRDGFAGERDLVVRLRIHEDDVVAVVVEVLDVLD